MLDLQRLRRLRLSQYPIGQKIIANLGMRIDYNWPKKTEIILEGVDNIPKGRSVYFAMNHTDRYNYWPFQYAMYRKGLPFTATWVKGKYYENKWLGAFMDANNNIPLPSRGYVLSTELRAGLKRVPTDPEYRSARQLINGEAEQTGPSPDLFAFYEKHGGAAAYAEAFEARFNEMMAEVVRLTTDAFDKHHLNLLVFPQGTRSIQLSQGHTGLMEMAQTTGHAILPVGCNGSDLVYPGGSPFAKGGRIVYRIGKPLEIDGPELAPYRLTGPLAPFTRQMRQHEEKLKAATEVVMDHINLLLDPKYQYSETRKSDGVGGSQRFL